MLYKFILLLSFVATSLNSSVALAKEPKALSETLTVDCRPIYANYEIKELLEHANCGTVDETGLIHIYKDTIDLISFNQNPDKPRCLSLTLSNGKTIRAFVNKNGLGRSTYSYHGSLCGHFGKNGISTTYINNKIAYIDENMSVVHQTNYEFIDGSVICTKRPEKYRPAGHVDYQWRGGICGYRDKNTVINGNETTIVPIKYTLDAIPFPEHANYLKFSFRVIKRHLGDYVTSTLNIASERIKTEMGLICNLPCDKYAEYPAFYNGTHRATWLYLRFKNGEEWEADIIFDKDGRPKVLSLDPIVD